MSHRITWKSRPRSCYPWLYQTGDKTLADLGIGAENPYDLLIGPLTMQAVVELLYRVIQFDFDLSVTADVSGTPVTQTGTGQIRMNYSSGDPTELEVFTRHRTFTDDEYPGFPGETSAGYEFATIDLSNGYGWMLPVSMYWSSPDQSVPPIFKDENGMFWLQGAFDFLTDPGDPVQFYGGNGIMTSGGYLLQDADLVLASGTFPIKCGFEAFGSADVTSASLTITASEWFPYKTTVGDPAWDTATGAPINGGPGA